MVSTTIDATEILKKQLEEGVARACSKFIGARDNRNTRRKMARAVQRMEKRIGSKCVRIIGKGRDLKVVSKRHGITKCELEVRIV